MPVPSCCGLMNPFDAHSYTRSWRMPTNPTKNAMALISKPTVAFIMSYNYVVQLRIDSLSNYGTIFGFVRNNFIICRFLSPTPVIVFTFKSTLNKFQSSVGVQCTYCLIWSLFTASTNLIDKQPWGRQRVSIFLLYFYTERVFYFVKTFKENLLVGGLNIYGFVYCRWML